MEGIHEERYATSFGRSRLFLDASVVVVEWLAVFTDEIASSTVSIFRSFRFVRLRTTAKTERFRGNKSTWWWFLAPITSCKDRVAASCGQLPWGPEDEIITNDSTNNSN